VDLGSFSVKDAKVEASGGSQVVVYATGRLDVDASGGSHIIYVGGPSLEDVSTSEDSSVAAGQ
jgi:hypothetical protein